MRVTYYLGAGASANALPTYSNLHERLKIYGDFIFHLGKRDTYKDYKLQFETYQRALTWLTDETSPTKSETFDAFAEELYLNDYEHSGNFGFDHLKYLLCDFLSFEQMDKKVHQYYSKNYLDDTLGIYTPYSEEYAVQLNTNIDRRYRSLLNSITARDFEGRQIVDPRINFISWNYDIQLELAAARAWNIRLKSVQNRLRVMPSPGCTHISDVDRSCVVKLNGTAGIFGSSHRRYNLLEDSLYSDDFFIEMMKRFDRNKNRADESTALSFAFEQNSDNSNRSDCIKVARRIVENTEVLIVIGYSFHPTNRNTDTQILTAAKQLKKIIIQDPNKDNFDTIKKRIKFLSEVEIEHEPSVYSFRIEH